VKLLLDTCTFLWLATGDRMISADALSLFQDPRNEAFLSAVSGWEIAVNNLLGGLRLLDPVELFVPRYRALHGIESLPLTEDSAVAVAKLPPIHRDPFDRMLVCQAMSEAMTILTPDVLIRQYPVKTIW
jgi:PIN domain nuclease of toxin-antitoxin system